jgi:hypothetical protein
METLEVTGYMSDEVQLTLQRVKDDFVKAYVCMYVCMYLFTENGPKSGGRITSTLIIYKSK